MTSLLPSASGGQQLPGAFLAMTLITDDNRIPIADVAPLIRRTPSSAIDLARRGKLAAIQDAGGRWWSSREAAEWFMLGRLPEDYPAGAEA